MDLGITAIPLLAGFLGYNFMKNGKNPRKIDNIRKEVSPYDTPSGTNIYRSVNSKVITQDQQKLANIRYAKSKDSKNTNIIPEAYNTSTCNAGDSCNINVSPVKDTRSLLPQVSGTINLKQQQLQNMEKSPMFKLPIITEKNGTLQSSGFEPILGNFGVEGFENPNNGGFKSSLSGQYVDTDKINMVPHFGSTIKQNVQPDKNEGLLDRYNGPKRCRKKEVPAFFEPVKENIFGTQVTQDRSKYVQSNLKTGLLPLPQVKVSPLPAASVRPQYRTQEQLNVNSRQSNRYIKNETGGAASQAQRPIIGHQSKNKPETSWEWGPDRLFAGSTIKGQTVRENFTNGHSNITETPYNITPAGSNVPSGMIPITSNSSGDGLFTMSRPDHRQTDHTSGIRNATFTGPSEINDIARDSYIANENQRDTTSSMFLLPAGNNQAGEYHALTDQAKITTKQTNLFSYTGAAGKSVSNIKDYTSDYNHTRTPARPVVKNYTGGAGHNSSSVYTSEGYENVEIKSNREVIDDLKNYILEIEEGSKISAGACSVNIQMRDDQLGKTKWDGLGFQQRNIIQEINGIQSQGEQETRLSKIIQDTDQTSRIDPLFVKALSCNPYNLDITKGIK
jgi:hypothetical protein